MEIARWTKVTAPLAAAAILATGGFPGPRALPAQTAGGEPPDRAATSDRETRPWEGFRTLEEWEERAFTDPPTRYRVAPTGGGGRALRARSRDAASLLWRPVEHGQDTLRRIRWRWMVLEPIPADHNERTAAGDDYAARLFLAFGPDPFSGDGRALCYVWAAREPVGSVYRNPRVGRVVVRSGRTDAGSWVPERRDFVADYRGVFGEAPGPVSGIGLMVDTDDTGSTARAWFDDIRLE